MVGHGRPSFVLRRHHARWASFILGVGSIFAWIGRAHGTRKGDRQQKIITMRTNRKNHFNGQLTIGLECLPSVANRQQSKQIARLRMPRRSANGCGELLPSRSIIAESSVAGVRCAVRASRSREFGHAQFATRASSPSFHRAADSAADMQCRADLRRTLSFWAFPWRPRLPPRHIRR